MLKFTFITSQFICAFNTEHISWKLPTDVTDFKRPSYPNNLKHRIAGWETERKRILKSSHKKSHSAHHRIYPRYVLARGNTAAASWRRQRDRKDVYLAWLLHSNSPHPLPLTAASSARSSITSRSFFPLFLESVSLLTIYLFPLYHTVFITLLYHNWCQHFFSHFLPLKQFLFLFGVCIRACVCFCVFFGILCLLYITSARFIYYNFFFFFHSVSCICPAFPLNLILHIYIQNNPVYTVKDPLFRMSLFLIHT